MYFIIINKRLKITLSTPFYTTSPSLVTNTPYGVIIQCLLERHHTTLQMSKRDTFVIQHLPHSLWQALCTAILCTQQLRNISRILNGVQNT